MTDWATRYANATKAAREREDTIEARLARMRLSLRTAREKEQKAARMTRASDGTFHTNVASHDRLASHLVGPKHGMAILPAWRGSTRNMVFAHEAAHINRAQDHAVDEMSE